MTDEEKLAMEAAEAAEVAKAAEAKAEAEAKALELLKRQKTPLDSSNLAELFPLEYSGIAKVTGIAQSKRTAENTIITFRDLQTKRIFKVTCSPDNEAINEAKALLNVPCDVCILPMTLPDGAVRGYVSSGYISKADTLEHTSKFVMPLTL